MYSENESKSYHKALVYIITAYLGYLKKTVIYITALAWLDKKYASLTFIFLEFQSGMY